MSRLLATDLLIQLTAKDWLGRPKVKAFSALKRIPKPREIKDYVLLGRRGVTAQDVEAAIKIFCQISGTVCGLADETTN